MKDWFWEILVTTNCAPLSMFDQMHSGYIAPWCNGPCKKHFHLQSPERTNVCPHDSCFIQKLLSIKTKQKNLHSKRPQQLLLCPNLQQLKMLKSTSRTYPNSTPTLPQQWGWGLKLGGGRGGISTDQCTLSLSANSVRLPVLGVQASDSRSS